MRHKIIGILGFTLIALALTACSSAPTPVEALTLRAKSNVELINASKWEEAYEYLSPRLREACTKDDYAALMDLTFSLIRSISGFKQKGDNMKIKIISILFLFCFYFQNLNGQTNNTYVEFLGSWS